MSIIYEKKFRIQDYFDKNNEYHLWIISFTTARQDLLFVNKKLIETCNSINDKDGQLYYLKMNIGHLREAINLIFNSCKDKNASISEKVRNVKGFNNLYDDLKKLIDITNVKSIYNKLLISARNNYFHYNHGKQDFENTTKVLENMYKENQYSGFIIGSNLSETSFYFAEEIQLNSIFEMAKEQNITQNELLYKIANITSTVIEILTLIIDDFLIQIANDNKGYKINYK